MPTSRLTDRLFSNSVLSWVIAGISSAVASWVVLQANGVINNDGVLYVESARQFDLGQWREGVAIYRWPLYPLLIALVHKISGFGLQASAHLLAILLFTLACVGIAKLVLELGGNRPTAACASLLLLASPYLTGDVLPMVVRDHGSWALHLWSVVFLLRYMHTPSWCHALAWGGCALGAMLFRIEAMTFLVLLPLIVLARPAGPLSARIAQLLKSQAVLLLSVFLMALALTITGFELHEMGRLHDPMRVLQQVYVQLAQGLEDKAQLMGEQVLGSFLDDYALAGLGLTLVYILIGKAISCAGWLQFGLALLVGREGPAISTEGKLMLKWLIALGLLNGAMILLKGFLLPGRMLAPIAFIVIVIAAFGLERLRQQWLHRAIQHSHSRWALPIVAVLLSLQLLTILWPSNPKDAFELAAARWAAAHTPQGSRILYDSARLAYYAGQPLTQPKARKAYKQARRILDSDGILDYDYALVHTSRKAPESRNTLRFGPPLATFTGSRGDSVLVYRIPH